MKGYVGKILYFNLSQSKKEIRDLDTDDAKKYIGGSGLGAKILFDETDEHTDPLGPENVLIFMTGPFTGTPVLCSSRYSVVSKSPLTGIFGESNSGGSWAEMLKKSGYDGIVIKGKAPKPLYLWLNNGEVELRDASHIWGKDTFEIDPILKSETNGKAVVASIGQAGEKCVPLAAIMNDGIEARAAGRCGMGAVMGSKNLKAVVVRGDGKTDVKDLKGLNDSIKELSKGIVEETLGLKKLGTSGALAVFEEMGSLPLQNWRYVGRWKEGAQKIAGRTLVESYVTGNYSCKRCIIGCGKKVEVKDGPYKSIEQPAPEYETLALMGSNCLVDDLEAIIKANELCNKYGLDTMGTGSVIAFGMEAFEKGLITKKDTEGIDLIWGNGDAVVEMVKKIGESIGIGKVLGLGSKEAANLLGKNAEEFAIHVKGLDFAAHDPRAYNAGAVNFATSARGACHLSGLSHVFERALIAPEIDIPEPIDRFKVSGKGILTAKTQDYMGMLDALEICKFTLFGGLGISTYIKWYNYVTGEEMDVDRFVKTGERIFNLKRLYNVKCGISRKDDFLPSRILTWKKAGEGLSPNLPPLGTMLGEYYEYRGWSEDGIPLKEKLEELEIE
ncbi:MAG: aldehyde ferredoxin oxidoreductase family protein [Desulfobacteraceae bacterium]|nr:MAG: aldehyde ferredoxin oxidoreductase family protein [Desulfobacteraceae bacterium]